MLTPCQQMRDQGPDRSCSQALSRAEMPWARVADPTPPSSTSPKHLTVTVRHIDIGQRRCELGFCHLKEKAD